MKEIRMTIPEDQDERIVRKRAQEHLLEAGYVKDIGIAEIEDEPAVKTNEEHQQEAKEYLRQAIDKFRDADRPEIVNHLEELMIVDDLE